MTSPLLSLDNVVKHFKIRRGPFGGVRGVSRAVDGVSMSIAPGETLGLVGESGCGKSTLGKLICRLHEPTGGTIRLNGVDISHMRERALRPLRRDVQMVFQDPYSSLNPRMRAGRIVGEPLDARGVGSPGDRSKRVAELLEWVGLGSALANGYPNAFSGGQRQRLAIARALALDPQLIVADEPVSALDVSVQAQVLNLMARLRQKTGSAFLFVSHDLAVVEHVSDRVAVMYLGRIVETAPKNELFASSIHPYTEMLMEAAPRISTQRPRRRIEGGEIPSPLNPPSGCRYRTRCPIAEAVCAHTVPPLREVAPGHLVACHVRAPEPAEKGSKISAKH